MKCTKEYRMQFDERAVSIVSQMTLEEKIHMMAGHSEPSASMGGGGYNLTPYPFGGCERLGVPELHFCDGPRGCVSGSGTCFPVPMARGASFDVELERQIGQAIGWEILANGGDYFGGVCMNIPYHPGAGRSQECYGEDSFLMGEMASALMEGVQEENVIACCKHFAFNSMERSRFKVNVSADKRTEQEVFLPHFRKVIERGCASVMNAYNRYRGRYCGHSPYLLREILKRDWDFDGFVISDFAFGVRSAGGGISGGCDVEMHLRLTYTEKKVKAALKKGEITEDMLNEACRRIVRTTLAFTEARKGAPLVGRETMACREHIALARRAAEESITLLQNKNALLPLSRTAKLVLVGDLADTENIGDHGSSKVRPPYVTTLTQALRAEYPQSESSFIPTGQVKKSLDDIRKADCAVIVCGMSHGDEGEYLWTHGGDRRSLALHKRDLRMIDLVSAANPNTVVVLMGGNVILTHSWQDKVKAILFAYYPGMEGGGALADVLFGKVNPSGHLPFAIARREEDYPVVRWNTREQQYDYWHGYHKLDRERKPCDFPFGHGLSYTRFAFGEARLIANDEKEAVFEVPVSNLGERAGDEVVQLYVSFPESPVPRPVRTLAAFARVHTEPGETVTATFRVQKDELRWYDVQSGRYVRDSGYEARIGASEHSLGDAIRF